MAFDPVTAAIQAGIGGIAGGVGAYSANSATRKGLKQSIANQKDLQGDIREIEAGRTKGLADMYAPMVGDIGGTSAAYYDALGNTDYSQFDLQDPGEFEWDQQAEIQKQLNPELDAIINRATGAVTQSAANAGKLFSGAAGKDIARQTADIQAKEWGAAADRANTQYGNKYKQWTDKFDQAAKIAGFNKGNVDSRIANLGTKFGAQSGAYTSQIGAQQGVQNSADTAWLQSHQAELDAEAKRKGMQSPWAAIGQGILGGASSAVGLGSISTEK